METMYRRIEIADGNSTEPVQYVGVYTLNWKKEWGEPEVAFVEDLPDLTDIETGIQIISKERQRHFTQEGWTADHDAEHHEDELACAAGCYALAGGTRGTFRYEQILELWPWEMKWWKPTPDDRVRELAKAGALIAAEIDRINGVDGNQEQT